MMSGDKLLYVACSLIFVSTLFSYASKFQLGLENISENLIQKIKKARIGLITNQTGKDQKRLRNIDILLKRGLNIKAILVPEHGLDGTIPAGKDVHDTFDQKTRIPIISLYKNKQTKKEGAKNIQQQLDVIIFDIQDSGTRHYTYISTMLESLNLACKFGLTYVILDRPNPLGHLMEGPLVEPKLKSFVSIAPIPLRHAMTIGELGRYFNKHILTKPAKLEVVPMKGYKRNFGLQDIPFTMLSPNIASRESCYGYSFLGLLSAINPFDVGLKTDSAFQIILLPEKITLSPKKWQEFNNILKKYGILGTAYKRYHIKNQQYYSGIKLKINDITKVHTFSLTLDMLEFFMQAGINVKFAPIFDKLAGTETIRHFVNGTRSRSSLAPKINMDLKNFFSAIKPSLLYEPLPTPILIMGGKA